MTDLRPGPRIDIALTVFNGERHLDAFMSSIEKQTYPAWRLVVRDDGSSDATPAKLARHAARLPTRIEVLKDDDGNLGVVRGFSRVLSRCDAPYMMWADGDDEWLSEKVESTLQGLMALERESRPDTPCMVFTDLVVADPDCRPVAPSFWEYERIRVDQVASLSLLSRGIVTGCTVMMNRALQRIVLPIPEEAISHDWWASLIASLCGRIRPVHSATVLYRQHGGNDLGAKQRSVLGYVLRAGQVGRMVRKCVALRDRTRAQARAAYERAMSVGSRPGVHVDPARLEVVKAFALLGTKSALPRKAFLMKNGIIREDPIAAGMKYLFW